jgi:exopolyphosphatase/pppGpp-phosphohydrolase
MNFVAPHAHEKATSLALASAFMIVPWGEQTKWGEQLYACTRRADGDIKAGKVMIIDVGSHSIKYDVYMPSRSRHSIEADGEFDALGRDMIIDDPEPRLNNAGMTSSLKRTLPGFKKRIDAEKIDTICVVVTEAGRAAHEFDPQAVEAYLSAVATTLNIPYQSINILSKKMEAQLGAGAVLRSAPDATGDVYIMGGNSLECVQLVAGVIRQTVTLRMGTNSLAGHGDLVAQIIDDNLDKIPWLKEPSNATSYFVGGPFRPLGREAAQAIYRIRYDAKPVFNGFGFSYDAPFRQELANLKKSNAEDLRANFVRAEYASVAQLYGKRAKNWHAKTTQEIMRWTRSPQGRAWTHSHAYRVKQEKWEKKIGRRADTMSIAATFVDEVAKRSQPRGVIFCSHNMRDGLLDYGLK